MSNSEHEHTHAHEHTYTHEHPHSHEHPHEHDHDHEHTHSHEHTHDDGPKDIEKVKALLTYMISHNDHHAEEMADLLDSLPENPREKLQKAIGMFEAANVELGEVLESLKQE